MYAMKLYDLYFIFNLTTPKTYITFPKRFVRIPCRNKKADKLFALCLFSVCVRFLLSVCCSCSFLFVQVIFLTIPYIRCRLSADVSFFVCIFLVRSSLSLVLVIAVVVSWSWYIVCFVFFCHIV